MKKSVDRRRRAVYFELCRNFAGGNTGLQVRLWITRHGFSGQFRQPLGRAVSISLSPNQFFFACSSERHVENITIAESSGSRPEYS
jgi:hypothetical protein